MRSFLMDLASSSSTLATPNGVSKSSIAMAMPEPLPVWFGPMMTKVFAKPSSASLEYRCAATIPENM